MQIEHPNFLIKIYFVNIKQTTQLQLVPEDKVAILCIRFPMSGAQHSLTSGRSLVSDRDPQKFVPHGAHYSNLRLQWHFFDDFKLLYHLN